MTYPDGDKVAVDASEVTIKPVDLGEIRAALEGGEYLVLLAITADDRVVAYHSSSFVPEQTEADVSRSSVPEQATAVTKSSFSLIYTRCCHRLGRKRGIKLGNMCIYGRIDC